MTPEQRAYLTDLKAQGGVSAVWKLADDACRRCSVANGLSPDWRCHSNASPIDADCGSLHELIDERIANVCPKCHQPLIDRRTHVNANDRGTRPGHECIETRAQENDRLADARGGATCTYDPCPDKVNHGEWFCESCTPKPVLS